MTMKKEKNSIWIYAVILFSCAFMILLLTFYSQEKLQKNTEKYTSQLTHANKSNETVITNLKTARELNSKLQKQIDSLTKELEDAKNQAANKEIEFKAELDKVSKNSSTNGSLASAAKEYIIGEDIACGDILSNINQKELTNQEKNLFNILSERTSEKAAYSHYKKGYGYYYKSKYYEAIKEFDKVAKFSSKFYFTDDSYWFKAYSYLKNNDKEKAKSTYDQLVEKFPKSDLALMADDFYSKLN